MISIQQNSAEKILACGYRVQNRSKLSSIYCCIARHGSCPVLYLCCILYGIVLSTNSWLYNTYFCNIFALRYSTIYICNGVVLFIQLYRPINSTFTLLYISLIVAFCTFYSTVYLRSCCDICCIHAELYCVVFTTCVSQSIHNCVSK